MARLFLLIGIPGSGKSFLAANMQRDYPGRILISTDAIRSKLFGDEAIQGAWLRIQREVQRQFREAVCHVSTGQAQAAIYDATNAVRRQRREAIALARYTGFTHITGIWLDTPLAVCLERNRNRARQVPEEVILRMHRRLMGAPPSRQEGLNYLIYYSSSPPTHTAPSRSAKPSQPVQKNEQLQ